MTTQQLKLIQLEKDRARLKKVQLEIKKLEHERDLIAIRIHKTRCKLDEERQSHEKSVNS